MAKRFVLLTVLLLLVCGAGGVFLWRKAGRPAGRPTDYTVSEKGQERIVENKKAGLKVAVPEGWTVEKMEVEEGSMVFYSPDAEGVRTGRVRPPLKKGCMIEVAVIYKKMSFGEIEQEVRRIHDGLDLESDQFENDQVQNRQSLKNVFQGKLLGYGEASYIPANAVVYSMVVYAPAESQEQEKCSQEFDKLLETVSIE